MRCKRAVAQWALLGIAVSWIFIGARLMPCSDHVVGVGAETVRLDYLLLVMVPFFLSLGSVLLGFPAFEDVRPPGGDYPRHLLLNLNFAISVAVGSWMMGCMCQLFGHRHAARWAVIAPFLVLFVLPKTVLGLARSGRTPLLVDGLLCSVTATLLSGFMRGFVVLEFSAAGRALGLLLDPRYWLRFMLPASLIVGTVLLATGTSRGRRWLVFVAALPILAILIILR